ncbi:pseudouridylate synthase RPUSD2 [Xenentodon cancila]
MQVVEATKCGKRKSDETDEPETRLKGKKRRGAGGKSIRPGERYIPPPQKRNPGVSFNQEHFNETSCYFEGGLRKVTPYYFDFKTYCKGRWVGKTLEEVFKNEFRAESIEYYQKAAKEGRIRLNETPVEDLSIVLRNNDHMRNTVHRHEPPVVDAPLEILADDGEVLVVDKPASIPVHPCGRFRHNSVIFILGKERGISELHTVHRLDRLTSGVLLFARTLETSKKLDQMVRDRRLEKEYVCRVEGEFPEEEVICEEPILVVSFKIGLCRVDPKGKECRTVFQRLSFNGKTSVVRCLPLTGRTHQIRVHLQYLGFPILKDPIYGSSAWGPHKGKGGHVGKSDEELLQALVEEHRSQESLHLLDITDDCIDGKKEEGKQCGDSQKKSDGSSERGESGGSCEAQVGSCEGDDKLEGSESEYVNTKNTSFKESQNLLPATSNGNQSEAADSGQKTASGTRDPLCSECKVVRPDPTEKELIMYLHALRYKGPDFEYSTRLPVWAKEDWVEEDEKCLLLIELDDGQLSLIQVLHRETPVSAGKIRALEELSSQRSQQAREVYRLNYKTRVGLQIDVINTHPYRKQPSSQQCLMYRRLRCQHVVESAVVATETPNTPLPAGEALPAVEAAKCGKRKNYDTDEPDTRLKGKKRRGAGGKSIRPGERYIPPPQKRNPGVSFNQEHFNETSCYFEGGLRKVTPYFFDFKTYCKGRWVGKTLEEVFKNELRAESIEYYQKAAKEGRIRLNETPVEDLSIVLRHKDLMRNTVHRHEPPVVDTPLEILADDGEVLVVDKPASIPVHPCGRFRHNSVIFILGKELGISELHTVHRLDRLTSGVLLFARTLEASKKLDQMVRDRRLEKEYVCRVEGEFPEEEVICEEPILDVSFKIGLCRVDPKGKDCRTVFQRLSFNGKTSVVRCLPLTGRTHQIRVHLQYLGFPILKDPIYGSSAWGPHRGKGGHVGKSDEELLQALVEEHRSQESLHLLDITDDCIDGKKEEGKQCGDSQKKSDGSSERGESGGSCEAQVGSCEGDDELEGSESENVNTKNTSFKESQNLLPATSNGNQSEAADSVQKTASGTRDPLCSECKVVRPDPTEKELIMYLHALRYKGPDFEYSTRLPVWAKEDWVEEDE